MGKRYNQSDNQKYQQFDDDFEDFGYEVKNIRRQTKKKVAKFKRDVNEYDDTYWSGTLISHSSLDRVFYTCSRDFFMTFQEQEFHAWLQSCPVQWFLLDSDDEQKSYQFIVDSSEEDDDERGQDSAFMDDNFGGWINVS